MYNYKYVNKDSSLMRVELSTPRIWSWSCLQALGHALQSEGMQEVMVQELKRTINWLHSYNVCWLGIICLLLL